MMNIVYIAIGSNLGNRQGNCLLAIDKISALPNTSVMVRSKLRETAALTPANEEPQPNYINGVIKVQTALTPNNLLLELKKIETALGRPIEHKKWSARVIDLDILLYNDLIIANDRLKIPHPEMAKRRFVLEPLCDIEPTIKHPALIATAGELLKDL